MYNIVLIWAWWAGVSSLWWLLLELWYKNIIAVNNAHKDALDLLKKNWAKVFVGHWKYEVQAWDVVIYSAAALESIEVQQAFSLHEQNYKKAPAPMLFHECLGEISKYFRTIAVTGTHGKSSTSSLCAAVMKQCSDDFWLAVIWAQVVQWDNNSFAINTQHKDWIRSILDHIFFRKGQPIGSLMKKWWFVVEADEYNKHFLFQDPDYALITSCELDHLDTYGDQETYYHTFYQFMKKVKDTIYAPQWDNGIEKLSKHASLQEWNCKEITLVERNEYSFDYMIWWHNHNNASLVEACLQNIIPNPHIPIKTAINQFRWIKRRAELLGETKQWVAVYSDYGHHPSEIASTIAAFREKFPQTLMHVLFEPHQMGRVVQFWDEFLQAMQPRDNEYRAYMPIFAARETVQWCKESFPLDSIIHSVETSEELSILFAQQASAPLLDSNEAVYKWIDSPDTWIIIFFSAWALDSTIRAVFATP